MKILYKVLAAWLCVAGFVFAGEAAQVQLFSPQGAAKEVRQVTVRFSEPMVPLGDPRLEDPFSIECTEKGKGRWVDGKNWVYDFEQDLPAGVVCEFKIKSDLKTLAEETLSGPRSFSFNTGGPAVRASRPEEGSQRIDERQVFIFSLDAEPEAASVLKQVYCSVEGVQERVGLRLVQGPEKEKLFKELKVKNDPAPTLVFQCRQTFPPESEVKIIWGRGVKAASGVSTTADQVLAFKTRKPFLAKLSGKKEKPVSGFIPLLPMTLTFSAPVTWDTVREIRLKSQGGKIWKPKKREESGPTVDRVVFEGPFPEDQSFTLHLPKNITDDSGRPLTNQDKFPLTVKTDRYPSLAKFASRFGIIESKETPLLPVTVRNLEAEVTAWMTGSKEPPEAGGVKAKEVDPRQGLQAGSAIPPNAPETVKGDIQSADRNIKGRFLQIRGNEEEKIIEWLNVLRTAKRKTSLLKGREKIQKLALPKPGGPKEFEVLGIPLKAPGFYVVELESEILGSRLLAKPAPMYVPAAALVTNLSAHFKWGQASSLVWVTSLDKGEPVQEASITLRDCAGKRLWMGKTDTLGLARITVPLPSEDSLRRCSDKQEVEEYTPVLSGLRGGIFVFAKAGQDLTFTHSSWNQGIEPWRFNVPTGTSADRGSVLAHTVFDRTLFRAGEEVHMKHVVRRRSQRGLFIPAEIMELKELVVEQAGSNQPTVFPLKWRTNGTAETVFKIPEKARLGTYEVYLATPSDPARSGSGQRIYGGSFRVEEFRVPLMKAVIQGPREPLVNARELEVDLAVSFLSGGGAADLPVKIRMEIQPKSINFPDYEEAIFSNGGVKTGLEKFERSEEGSSSQFDEEDEGQGDAGSKQKRKLLQTRELTLDKQGGARTRLSGLPVADTPLDLLAELEFRDPNGEMQTVATRISTYPSPWLVGITSGIREPSASSLSYQVVVLDLKGRPRANVEVKTTLFQRKTYSHRKRLAGGFYAYEHVTEIKEIGPHFRGQTDQNGILYGEGPSSVTGPVLIQAEVTGETVSRSLAHREFWIPGKDDLWSEARNDDRIDILPDKKQWEPGEQARFQVKMPFREATALITVEREGVLEAAIRKLSRVNPFVEIPVKENYAPNVFVSALVVRGRVPGSRPTATFDPGKPAYKLGLTEIRVGWKAHELKVEVLPDKKIYTPRETVAVRLKVKTADGKTPPPGSEAAVAVVDEGLLELKPNESWKLLEAMMKRAGCDVETATAQMMVIGKRHFGRKALPHGGGGGRQLTRELFDTLLYWKGVVPLDENGEAAVKFPLNDSLTSFRITAVVNGGEGFFGTGGTTIRATQELMILSGIPPLVREGDRFLAGFTIRNASSREMRIEAALSVKEGAAGKALESVRETIPAGEAKEIGWEVTAPLGIEKEDYEAFIQEIGGTAQDRVKVSQKVAPAVTVRSFQATLFQLKEPVGLEVEMPGEAIPGRGGTRLALKPKLLEGLGGLTEYMKKYPYLCLEQKLSKAIVAREKEGWRSLMAELPSYLDDQGLAKYFPNMKQGSEVLTAYVLAISHEAGQEIPAPLRKQMVQGLKAFIEGRVIRQSAWPAADLTIRKLSAVEALSRYGEAHSGLLNTIVPEPPLWPASAVLDWINVLERVKDFPERLKKLKEAEQNLRSRLNLQGTLLGLSTEKTDNLWWLMASPDTNAVRALLTTLPLKGWKEDHPRMVRGLLERMKRGHWDTTPANAWGLLALEKFGALHESAPVTGVTEATFLNKTGSVDWTKTPSGGEIAFPWGKKKETLQIAHKGSGSPWAFVTSRAALPLKQPFFSGYTIKKTLIPVEQKTKGLWSKGDVIRVRLELESQADRTWVVVSDPIPGGAMILGSGLGRDSSLLSGDEQERGRVWETFRERSLEALRVYFELVLKGKWTVEYTLRLNNEGLFYLPETRAEALYSPEMFGELPNRKMEVKR
jgi:uncharacterized protein YfaS (alpha-2-macroglobulin family)